MKRILSLMLAAGSASTASAFYFPDWPGARLPPQRAIVQTYTPGDPPSVLPPTPPVTTPQNPENPNGVPEPTGLVLAGMGVLAWGLRRYRRSL